MIGDSTGVSNAFLPAKIEIKEGDSIVLFNASAKVVKEHIEIQLSRAGGLERSKDAVNTVSEEYNLSHKAWVPV